MSFDFLNDISDSNRHNLIILQCKPEAMSNAIAELGKEGINVINIGKALSEKFKDVTSTRFLAIEAQDYFQRLLELESKVLEETQPEVVAIHNLGILFEPTFGLDGEAILKDASKRRAIIILWENNISSPVTLHWGTEQQKYHLDFSDIHLAKVHNYEV